MTNFRVLFVILLVQGLEFSLATNCTLPNGEEGECIISTSCPGYSEILERENLTTNELNFLRLVQCGYEFEEPAVCCSLSGKYNDTNISINTTSSSKRDPYVDLELSDRIQSGFSALPSFSDCGIQYYQPDRIIGGGIVTSFDEFPWMALLQYSKKGALCGGVLIGKKHVLTAAHCVTEPLLSVLGTLTHVRLGEYDITTDQDCDSFTQECADLPQDLKVEKVFVHPEFNSAMKNQHHDIAVIKLTQEARYNYFVQPICLPVPDHRDLDKMEGRSLFVSGWGLTEKSIPSPIKMKLKVPVVSPNACGMQYKNFKIQLTPNQICAGGEVRKGTTSGDSGGPLMAYDKYADQWFCVGVVSLGLKKIGNVGIPGVYTKVYDYLDWIRESANK
ncbi:phenoloxidase-activating factor 1-like [Ctenocephalides felis]|uniref:phenoloxidase-activating factor 1-like n=1 Tax=Ctenocephalides felis TaxID=7515 RepID=UPI000E6E183C|nr:phenoloxidase-activating factor 1-like [Ctenocephalides felis]